MSDVKTRRLTPGERDAAVLAAKAGDGEARRRLIEDCYGLIVRHLHKLGAHPPAHARDSGSPLRGRWEPGAMRRKEQGDG